MTRPTVIIAGAGPSGMCAALFLVERHGIPVLVIERSTGDATDPRAATFHPPTLEMLAPSGVTQMLMDEGIVAAKWQRRDRKEGLVAEFDLGVLENDTTFPFRLQCEQHKLVNIIRRKLAGNPLFELRQGEEITALDQDESGVTVTTDKGSYTAQWLVGADGGRSIVRKSRDFAFEGFTYAERFLVITTDFDFEAEGYAFSNYVSDPKEWCAVFKVPAEGPPGLWRTVFPTKPEEDEAELTDFANCRARMEAFIGAGRDFDVVHTNLYTVNQRVASSFRDGRILLAGDAAHLNNPLGGMGMNFGIHDAENLARSLAEWHETGEDAPLDRYDRQRRFAAQAVLQSMTIANKESLEQSDAEAAAAERANFRRLAGDPVAARAYLLKTAMIEGFNKANSIP
ncbi:NAD(P)/FAD-dependent oxidoreductase [Novosphingobium resinovorum]|uniref:FAD-dependent oxidoreductase n=1 Tax=Novosphingobium resinovorum TaxID=158500 RepID=UPI002ED23F0F|nr:NAD(P)/FAD-dependent oxidoreductase [Novosphingobium resinovorum]